MHLRIDTKCREFGNASAVDEGVASGAVVFAEGESGVTWFIGASCFAGDGGDTAVCVNGIQVMPDNGTGHVQALSCEILHV